MTKTIKRPSLEGKVYGNHERRIRGLEFRTEGTGIPAPPSPSAVWLVGGYQGAILEETSLVAYYRLDPTIGLTVDSSAVPTLAPLVFTPGGAGTSVDGPASIADGNKAYSQGALNTSSTTTDSTGDFITVTHQSKLNLTDFSMEAWIYPSSTQPVLSGAPSSPQDVGPIFWNGPNSGSRTLGWVLAAIYSSPYDRGQVQLGLIGTNSQYPSSFAASRTTVLTDNWYHIVVTHNASSGVTRLYINGILADSYLNGSPNPLGFLDQINWDNVSNDLSIGSGKFYNSITTTNYLRTFCGVIDEVAIYNQALSAAQVLLHYNASGLDSDTGHWVDLPYGAGAFVGTSSIDTNQIADKAVTTPKIADQAITTALIADSAVTTTQILNGTIVAADLSTTLKPSGTAADTTEALRKLGTTAGTAMSGTNGRAAKATPAYSASITPDSSAAVWQTITATNGTAFTINAPSNAPASTETQQLVIEVLNSSGGALGAITWNAAFVFDLTQAWVNPANTMRRQVTFNWNGTKWVCTSISNADY